MEKIQYECDICDDPISIVNNDISTSVKRHNQTAYHLEVVKRLQAIHLGGDGKKSSHEELLHTDVRRNRSSPVHFDDMISCELFFCKVCQSDVHDSKSMSKHLESEKHNRLENFVKVLNVQRQLLKCVGFSHVDTHPDCSEVLPYFSNENDSKQRLCLVCECSVPSTELHMINHVRGVTHSLKLNSLFLAVGQNYSFYCFLCNEQNSGQINLDNHCVTDRHRRFVDLLYKFACHGLFF